MKRIDESLSKEYLPLRLDLDDLQEIETILKGVATEFTIEAGGFQFDSIDELASKFQNSKLKHLELKSHFPYVTLELREYQTRLYVGSSDSIGAGLFYRIDEILRKGRIFLFFFYSFYFLCSLSILLAVAEIIPNQAVRYSILLVILAWFLRVLFVRSYRHSTALIASKSRVGSFLSRKKDDLLLAIISAVIGAVLGVAVTLFVSNLAR